MSNISCAGRRREYWEKVIAHYPDRPREEQIEIWKRSNILKYPLELAETTGFSLFVDPVYFQWEKQLLSKHRRMLLLKPRTTYKSTLYSVIYPAWLLLKNPNKRIIIVGRTGEDSNKYIDQIRQILNHPTIVYLFGQQLPLDKNGNLRKQKARCLNVINHTDISKRGDNVRAYGMNSSITGAHCDIMIVDDPCDDHDSLSLTVRERRVKVFQQNNKVLEDSNDSQLIVVGTRKHPNDLYGYIIELDAEIEKTGVGDRYVIEVETPYNKDGTLRFPTYLPETVIEKNKVAMGRRAFSHEMLNCPMGDAEPIFTEEIFTLFDYKHKFVEIMNDQMGRFTLMGYLDLAIRTGEKNDYNALTVGAVEKKDIEGKFNDKPNLCILEGIRIKASPTTVFNTIIAIFRKYYRTDTGTSLHLLGIEGDGFQSEWIRNFKEYCKGQGVVLSIRPVETHGVSKLARIMYVEPFMEAGRIQVRSDWKKTQNEYYRELLEFPASNHDDCPDSLAGLTKLSLSSLSSIILQA
jgi:predicted phage terminase large subunit-like protein